MLFVLFEVCFNVFLLFVLVLLVLGLGVVYWRYICEYYLNCGYFFYCWGCVGFGLW